MPELRGASRLRPVIAAVIATTLALVLLVGAFASWQAHTLTQWQRLAVHELSELRARMETELYASLQLSTRLAAFVANQPALDQAAFAAFAQGLLSPGSHAVRHFAYAPGHVVGFVYPLTGYRAMNGIELHTSAAHVSNIALLERTGGMVISGPHALEQGGEALVVREPVFQELPEQGAKQLAGHVSTWIDVGRYFERAGVLSFSEQLDLSIRALSADGNPTEVFFGPADQFADRSVLLQVSVPGGYWELAARPHGGWDAVTPPPGFVFPLLLLLLGGVAFSSYRMSRQAQLLRASEVRMRAVSERLATLLSAMPNLVSVIDEDGRYADLYGGHDRERFQIERERLVGRYLEEVLPPEKARLMHDAARRALHDNRLQTLEYALEAQHACGSEDESREQWFRSTIAPLHDTGNGRAMTLWVTDNITAERRTELALKRSENRYRLLTDALQQVVFETDMSGRITYINPAWQRLCPSGSLARPLGLDWTALLHVDDRAELTQDYHELIAGRLHILRHDARLARDDGTPWWVTAHLVPVLDGDGHAIVGSIGTLFDIDDRKRSETAIRHQALHDPLTGLANRLLLVERLEHALNLLRRQGTELALLFVDLDDFKLVNDHHGHLCGDQVLREVGARILDVIRDMDTAARIGGDEFVVLLEAIEGPESVSVVAEKLLSSLAQPISLPGGCCTISASIGVALAPRDGMEVDALLHGADLGLYRAKAAGKGVLRPGGDND